MGTTEKRARTGSEKKRSDSTGEKSLGELLRRLRREKGLTLHQVAEKAGLSASFLSQLETGQTNLSVSSLRQIASALDTSIFSLLAEVEKSDVLVRRGQRKTLILPNYNASFQLLSPTTTGAMEPALVTLAPRTSSSEIPMAHNCEEFSFLINGKVELLLGNERYVLEEGDSVYFSATIPHNYTNVGEEDAVMLTVMTPPNF